MYRPTKQQVNRELAEHWVEAATRHTLAVEDKALRGKACERLSALVRSWSHDPPIPLPQAIRDEYAKLWPEIESKLDADSQRNHIEMNTRLLPLDVQVDAIRQAFMTKRVRFAAGLVWRSELGLDDKATWYAQILTQVREIPELPNRSAALTGIAQCLRHDKPEQCLDLLWEGLRISQRLGLAPELHDGSDSLGTIYPLVTAEECMRMGFKRSPTDDRSTQALWSFARQLDRRDEQDPVLEKCVGLLLWQGQTEKAAGVIRLIGDPARRARAWGAVAVVKQGRPLRNDW